MVLPSLCRTPVGFSGRSRVPELLLDEDSLRCSVFVR